MVFSYRPSYSAIATVATLTCIAGSYIGFLRYKRHTAKQKQDEDDDSITTEYINILKNALLTYALFKTRKHDFIDCDISSHEFDGDKLPMLSGYDLINALFTYMFTPEFGSIEARSKNEAINKYLKRSFADETQVIEFVSDFVDKTNF